MGCGRGVVVDVDDDDDKVGDVDCAVVESEVDVVDAFAVPVAEPSIFGSVFVPSSTETSLLLPLIVISVIAAAVAELAGQSSTYSYVVVFSSSCAAPSEAPPPPLLLLLGVINSRETPPC